MQESLILSSGEGKTQRKTCAELSLPRYLTIKEKVTTPTQHPGVIQVIRLSKHIPVKFPPPLPFFSCP